MPFVSKLGVVLYQVPVDTLRVAPPGEKRWGASSGSEIPYLVLEATGCFKPRAQQAATKEEKLGGKTGATLGLFLLPCPLISAVLGQGQGAVISFQISGQHFWSSLLSLDPVVKAALSYGVVIAVTQRCGNCQPQFWHSLTQF